MNETECAVIKAALERVIKAGVAGKDIAILTGYSKQRTLLHSRVRDVHMAEAVTVETINGFQGKEADLVFVSTVRIGTKLGFMSDPRRVNVLLTRARRGLIVFGDEQMFVSI